MAEPIEELVRVSPAVWPGKALPVQPGDLSRLAPMGFGLGAPPVVRPWDRLEDVARRPSYYGIQSHEPDPFRGAPTTEPSGGTVYFDGDPGRENVAALLRLLRFHPTLKDYAVFVAEAENTLEQRFLKQVRVMSHGALGALYGVQGGDDLFREQPLTAPEMIWAFIEEQQARWGTGMGGALSGAMGGDGDWAKEALAFGLFVENAYWRIYRVWSRAWLVTK